MEEVREPPGLLFNSALETGVRSVVILNAVYPQSLDLTRLTWLDHLVVHTADIDGPPSLHPDIPQRTGELLVRRNLIRAGLKLMEQLHLIEEQLSDQGIAYIARDEAAPFVAGMRTEYSVELKARAEWIASYVKSQSQLDLAALIADRIGRWAVEFQGEANIQGWNNQ